MRSDLSAVKGVVDVETDVSEKSCQVICATTIDVDKVLNELATKNDKIEGFKIQSIIGD